jgi:hypothetical protein
MDKASTMTATKINVFFKVVPPIDEDLAFLFYIIETRLIQQILNYCRLGQTLPPEAHFPGFSHET